MPNDPFADAMNTSGYAGLIGPNPYLEYTGKVPMAGFYGAPTDAMGNPIASFTQAQQQHDAWNAANPAPAPVAGTTLNSTPAAWRQRPAARAVGRSDGLPTGTPTSGVRMASQPTECRKAGTKTRAMAGLSLRRRRQQGTAPQQQAPTAPAAPTEPHRHAPGLSRRALQPGQGDDAWRADAAGNQPDRTPVAALGAGAVSAAASRRRDDGRRRLFQSALSSPL